MKVALDPEVELIAHQITPKLGSVVEGIHGFNVLSTFVPSVSPDLKCSCTYVVMN